MDSIQSAVPDEIALEGLDGITLDSEYFTLKFGIFTFVLICCCYSAALWFRLSERLQIPLPFNERIKNDIWALIKTFPFLGFFEISKIRETPGPMDRKDYYFNTDIPDDVMMARLKASYYIYSYHPVEDPNVRGSCEEFETRKQFEREKVMKMSLKEVTEK